MFIESFTIFFVFLLYCIGAKFVLLLVPRVEVLMNVHASTVKFVSVHLVEDTVGSLTSLRKIYPGGGILHKDLHKHRNSQQNIAAFHRPPDNRVFQGTNFKQTDGGWIKASRSQGKQTQSCLLQCSGRVVQPGPLIRTRLDSYLISTVSTSLMPPP